MKIINNQIFSLYDGIMKFKTKELPIKVGFNILRNIQTIEPIYNSIIELKDNILVKYGEVQENGRVNIPNDKMEIVNKELYELGNIENDIELKIIKLSDIEDINLTVEDLEKLQIIIED